MNTESEADIGVGEEHELRLPGLGAAGYRWMLAPGQEDLSVSARQAPAPSAENPPPPGASADQVFLVSASKPGEYQVRFEQRRPWERGGQAHQAHTLTLRVH